MPGGEIAAIITAVLAGVGGLVLAIVNAKTQAQKSQVDALDQIINSLRCQLTEQQKQITDLQRENASLHERDNLLDQENRSLRGEVEKLRQENEALRAELAEYKGGKRKKDTGGL